jgi:hypothetical protein
MGSGTSSWHEKAKNMVQSHFATDLQFSCTLIGE